jgi:hypothetical protein
MSDPEFVRNFFNMHRCDNQPSTVYLYCTLLYIEMFEYSRQKFDLLVVQIKKKLSYQKRAQEFIERNQDKIQILRQFSFIFKFQSQKSRNSQRITIIA